MRSSTPPWPWIDEPQSFTPRVALDRGHRQSAEESHHRDDERHPHRLPHRERRRPPERRADQRRGEDAADEAFPRFARADHRRDLVFAEQLAPDVLQHVAELHDDDEEEEQPRVLAHVAGDLQHQQRRHVADAVDADHQSPLDLRAALEKAFESPEMAMRDGMKRNA